MPWTEKPNWYYLYWLQEKIWYSNHGLLINIFDSVDIGNPLLTWINSYLTNRKTFVEILDSDSISTDVHIPLSVSQGGHLSPLLLHYLLTH